MSQSKHRDIFETLKANILGGKCEDGRPLPSAPALIRMFDPQAVYVYRFVCR